MSCFIDSGPVTILGTVPVSQASDGTNPQNNLNHELAALPPRFPLALDSELAWSGADFVGEYTFIYELAETDKDEISAGLGHFKGS